MWRLSQSPSKMRHLSTNDVNSIDDRNRGNKRETRSNSSNDRDGVMSYSFYNINCFARTFYFLLLVFTLPAARSVENEDSHHHVHTDAFSIVIGRFANHSERALRPDNLASLLSDVYAKFKCDRLEPVKAEGCGDELLKCLTSTDIFSILQISNFSFLDEVAFNKASVIILQVISYFPSSCPHLRDSMNYEKDFLIPLMRFEDKGKSDGYFSRSQLSHLLYDLKHRYITSVSHSIDHVIDHRRETQVRRSTSNFDHSDPLALNRGDYSAADDHSNAHSHRHHLRKRSVDISCVDEPLLFDVELHAGRLGVGGADFEKMAALIIAFVVEGIPLGCKASHLPSSSFFINDIFESFNRPNGSFTEEEFEKLVTSLGIGKVRQNNHPDEDHHGHDHNGHDHNGHHHDDDHAHEKRRRRQVEVHDHEHTCFSSEQLLDIFGVFHSVGIDKHQFLAMCPALVQQVVTHACVDEERERDEKEGRRVSHDQAYGYGFLSVAVISAASICGILMVPCLDKGMYDTIISGLICLAIGTMLGDAVLHLIPQCLGLHSHESGSHDHSDETLLERLEEMEYLWKMSSVILALYGFYLLESLFAYLGRKFGDDHEGDRDHAHDHSDEGGHSHIPEFDPKKLHVKNFLRKDSQRSQESGNSESQRRPPSEYGSMTSMASVEATRETEVGISNPALCLSDEPGVGGESGDCGGAADATKNGAGDRGVVLTSHREIGEGVTNAAGNIELSTIPSGSSSSASPAPDSHPYAYENGDPELLGQFSRKPKGICGIPSVALLILIGDAIHNFADGIAIGAAFAGDLTSGLSTSVAIFMHEVPHEFGDFAVFISSGLSYKKALLLNLLSACTAFLGLFLGVSVASDVRVRMWILAITAGMFLYVSLVDMLPEVMHNRLSKSLRGFVVQNVGIWVGVGLMFLIALFEDSIKI